ncbi:hypothetical protein Tco_0162928 [Tanacetum coccineum]
MQDFRIASQESLMTTLITHVSSLQGQLSAALGQIQALQARGQTHADDREGAASTTNNMPPRRSSATARAAATATARAAAAAATPMTVASVKQLIKARVSVALANHETLRNSTNGQGDRSHNSDTRIRGTVCTPLFHISNCAVENQVKFATCTFLGNALTWWNSHMKTVTQDAAYLALMCRRMFHEESEEVEKYVGGLPDMIRGNVMSYQPKTIEKAIDFANDQMDKKVLTITKRQTEQKRKLEFNAGNNQGHQ